MRCFERCRQANDFTGAAHVYIACGYTDIRKGIDALTMLVQQQFQLDPCSDALFLFCGRKRDRIKALYWEGDGFVLLYKRLENGKYQWLRNSKEACQLTPQQYRWRSYLGGKGGIRGSSGQRIIRNPAVDERDDHQQRFFRDLHSDGSFPHLGMIGILGDVAEQLVNGDVDLHLRFHGATRRL